MIEIEQFQTYFSQIQTSNVNLASRLEGRAREGEIIISPLTMAKVQGKFHVDTIAIPNDDKIKSFEGINEYYKVLDTIMYTNYL